MAVLLVLVLVVHHLTGEAMWHVIWGEMSAVIRVVVPR